MRLEATLAHLRVRHQHQVVPALAGARNGRDVGERVEIRTRSADERDRVGVAHPDERERRLREEIVEGRHESLDPIGEAEARLQEPRVRP